MLKLLKKAVLQACVIYTILLTAVYTLGAFVNSSWVPTVQMVYSCLGLSLAVALLNLFLFSDKLVPSLRLFIHFVSVGVIFYLMFVVWGGYKANGGSTLIAMLIYLFVYIICAAIVGVYNYLTSDDSKSDSTDGEYKSMFNK